VANYGPISLLTAFSKVFERIIYDRLLQYIETNNILTDEQFGFRTFSSTDKASYKLIDGILNALNNKRWLEAFSATFRKLSIVLTTAYH
jgi:hypothetical protein